MSGVTIGRLRVVIVDAALLSRTGHGARGVWFTWLRIGRLLVTWQNRPS